MNTHLRLSATNLKKVFNRRTIFRNISFSVGFGEVLLVTGKNGSGKSTLVKIISDVLAPSDGEIEFSGSENAGSTFRADLIGLVSPYLQMYDEFSAEENLRYALSIRGRTPDTRHIHELLGKVFLFGRKDDPVRTYSSGMKQRMKYAFALAHNPPLLVLDEPTSNLDTDGIAMVKQIMQEQTQKGILIVATNDLSDVDRFTAQVDLNAQT
ncbi:MAG: ABC transporter ATP-binding protein [Bacteroidetes bacterium]|nr:ABC transporter ATP-binding protein [Bacteroidota bacterium]MCW5896287.1 ABC transporter ATP-binding protein [Bacteroidota bacterium]